MLRAIESWLQFLFNSFRTNICFENNECFHLNCKTLQLAQTQVSKLGINKNFYSRSKLNSWSPTGVTFGKPCFGLGWLFETNVLFPKCRLKCFINIESASFGILKTKAFALDKCIYWDAVEPTSTCGFLKLYFWQITVWSQNSPDFLLFNPTRALWWMALLHLEKPEANVEKGSSLVHIFCWFFIFF